jgi:hypothetical protein
MSKVAHAWATTWWLTERDTQVTPWGLRSAFQSPCVRSCVGFGCRERVGCREAAGGKGVVQQKSTFRKGEANFGDACALRVPLAHNSATPARLPLLAHAPGSTGTRARLHLAPLRSVLSLRRPFLFAAHRTRLLCQTFRESGSTSRFLERRGRVDSVLDVPAVVAVHLLEICFWLTVGKSSKESHTTTDNRQRPAATPGERPAQVSSANAQTPPCGTHDLLPSCTKWGLYFRHKWHKPIRLDGSNPVDASDACCGFLEVAYGWHLGSASQLCMCGFSPVASGI